MFCNGIFLQLNNVCGNVCNGIKCQGKVINVLQWIFFSQLNDICVNVL